MNNPLGVSPSKGKQGTTSGKKKIFLTSVGTNPRPPDGRSNPEVVVSIPTEVKKIIFFASCGSLFPFNRADAQWVIHGFN